MKLNRLSISAIILMIVAITAAFFLQPDPPTDTLPGLDSPTTPVTEIPEAAIHADSLTVETGEERILAEGVLVPANHQTLTFDQDGLLTEIFVQEGMIVDAGVPLLRLDSHTQEMSLVQAQSALVQAEAKVSLAQADLLIAQTGVTAATISLEAVEIKLALLEAGPTAGQIALYEALLSAADSGVTQAASNRELALAQPPTAAIRAAQARLAAAQADVVPAQITLDQRLRDSADDAHIQQAQLQLNAAIANVNAAQAALDQIQSGATNPERVAAGGQVNAAVAQREVVEAQLELLLLGTRPEVTALTITEIQQAKDLLTEAELRVEQAETAISQAEAQVQEALAIVEAATETLQQRTVHAPFAGTIAQMTLKEGQVVTAETPAVIIADLQNWQVKTTNLTELSVVTTALGFPAQITVDAFPNQTLTGSVTDIAAVSQTVRGDVTYEVTISLDEVTLPLRWGMTTFVTILVKQ